MSYTYKYPRPALTVDCVVFGVMPESSSLKILLVKRGSPPFEGELALPGGFVKMEESADAAVLRELREETGLEPVHVEQIGAYSEPKRDPRGRVVSVAFWALVHVMHVKAGSDAAAAYWTPVQEARFAPLAFDHKRIVADAIDRLAERVRREPIGFDLLPSRFTMSQLQGVYEACLGARLDRRNFRRRVGALGVLRRNGVVRGAHRPAATFSFDREHYAALVAKGINFEV